jgi:hypothetical protein
MAGYFTCFAKTRTEKLVFILSIIVSLFWISGRVITIYHFPAVAVFFEIFWFPIVIMTFVLPVVSMMFLIREKFSLRSVYLYSFIIVGATILLIIFSK